MEKRWESRFKIVAALHYRAAEVREAALEVRDKATDGNITAEGQSAAGVLDSACQRTHAAA